MSDDQEKPPGGDRGPRDSARDRAAAGRPAPGGPAPDRADEGPGDKPDMTRERARTERRDLDKERGEPVAGGAARGGPRALRPTARPLHDWSTRPKILITNDDGVESRGLLALSRESQPVKARAAKRVEGREGRPVRIPREPAPGIDPDVTG